MEEVWKIVVACPAYEVSSLGRVRRRLPGKRTRPGNILSTNGKVRYRNVTLVQDGERQSHPLHRLVCETFHGRRPSTGYQVAHLNGDSHDNRADNLAWVPQIENENHKVVHGTRLRGERAPGAKLSREQVDEIRTRHASRRSGYAATASDYGVDPTLVGQIIRNEIWRD